MRIYVVLGMVTVLSGCISKSETGQTENRQQKNIAATGQQSKAPATQKTAMLGSTKRTLAIQGMTCNGCAATVRTALLSVKGVRTVNVNLEKGIATIKCDASVNTSDLIRKVENYESDGVKQAYKARAVEDGNSSG